MAATGDFRLLKCAPHYFDYFGPAILSQVALLKKTTMRGPGPKLEAAQGKSQSDRSEIIGHQNVENHHEYKLYKIAMYIQDVRDTRCWLEFTVPIGIKQIPRLPFTHISFRVKFEDERPVQQAARMLGLEVEAENPLVLIQWAV